MNEHWTEIEVAALSRITSFEEMVPVGIEILNRMSVSNRHIIQICGPMSTGGRGSLAANMAYFNKAVTVAVEHGLCVFDQTPFQDAMIRLGADWDARREYCLDILHVFYRGIFRSRRIHELMFLPDWRSSVGASWENDEGLALGILISDYPPDWLHLLE